MSLSSASISDNLAQSYTVARCGFDVPQIWKFYLLTYRWLIWLNCCTNWTLMKISHQGRVRKISNCCKQSRIHLSYQPQWRWFLLSTLNEYIFKIPVLSTRSIVFSAIFFFCCFFNFRTVWVEGPHHFQKSLFSYFPTFFKRIAFHFVSHKS